jgi:MoxR-like ATPase
MLEKLGIYGWSKEQEHILLTSILTGDPLLMVGKHGSAKTATAYAIANALKVKFISYDASKSMFDDVLGFPNPSELASGSVSYVQSPLTIWDKDFILVDEINRPVYEMQSKWLEIIRSRRIMGFPTKVKWVWAAMNPSSYVATKQLDDALIGRFAYFLYVPDFMEMEEENRMAIANHINSDDAPAMKFWNKEFKLDFQNKRSELDLSDVMMRASKIFANLQKDSKLISEFVAKYAQLLKRDTNGALVIDGRRAGFIQRAILASKALSLAQEEEVDDFKLLSSSVVSALPIGLNSEAGRDSDLESKAVTTVTFFSSMFDGDIQKLYDIYSLLTTTDIILKLRLLLRTDIDELIRVKAWQELIDASENNGKDNMSVDQDQMTLFAYCALAIESAKPGSIPIEMTNKLVKCVKFDTFNPENFPSLINLNTKYHEDITKLFEQDSKFNSLVAVGVVRQWIKNLTSTPSGNTVQARITKAMIQELQARVKAEIESFKSIMEEANESISS